MWWVRGRHRYIAGKNILISKNDLCFLWTFLLLNVVYYKATYLLLPWGKLGWHKFPYSKCGKWREKKLDFYLFIFNWKIIALQYCAGFCHTSTWISHRYTYVGASPGGTSGKEPACQCRRQVRDAGRSLGQEDPLEECMATHSSVLA